MRRSKDRTSGLVSAGTGQGVAYSDTDIHAGSDDDRVESVAPVSADSSSLSPEQRAKILGLPYTDLADFSFDPKAVRILSEVDARNYLVVPLLVRGGRATMASAEPGRLNLVDELTELVGMPVDLVVSSVEAVEAAIDKAYEATTAVSDAVRVFEARVSERAAATATEGPVEVDANAPVVRVVSQILSQAVSDKASDVHIEPMGDRVRVRNRIDGALHEVMSLPQSMAQALVSRIKIMAELNIVERRRPQDGQIEAEVDGKELDIRVSTTSTVNGEKTVLRILDKSRAMYDIETLGMPDDVATVYREIIRSPYGMVVCAGPTGSGKTTTLYASLMAINNDEINVMTVEDPVEYTFPTINQIGIHEQAGVTFAAGLRSILRQDPDAILVGEIRDVETARIAIQAALTGHFVLSTIHATDAVSALHRFVDMGIESFLLASSMLAVVGQRLIRRSCPHCLQPYVPEVEDLSFYERMGGKPKEVFVKGMGCTQCSGTGYSGRIGVYEVLRITNEMRDLIVRNASVDEFRRLAVEQGMVPMRDQALRLVAAATTTIAEAVRAIYIL
ncbi:MAG: type II/IV secretion system protein [Acidimicrobiia bacterium]|nr:type II/IV secretion system protein [Acidimicrobiia bacterium]